MANYRISYSAFFMIIRISILLIWLIHHICFQHSATESPDDEGIHGPAVCRSRRRRNGWKFTTTAADGQTHTTERPPARSSHHWYVHNVPFLSRLFVIAAALFINVFLIHTSRNPSLLMLMSLGGFDVVKTRQHKGVCVSLATVYGGVFLEKYNLEVDLKPTLRIGRHNIPPFIPLNRLAEQSNMQTNLRAFLDTLSQHLNAYVGRRQQLELVKVPVFTFLGLACQKLYKSSCNQLDWRDFGKNSRHITFCICWSFLQQ